MMIVEIFFADVATFVAHFFSVELSIALGSVRWRDPERGKGSCEYENSRLQHGVLSLMSEI